KRPHDSELMAFADAELDEATSRELEAQVGRDGVARGKLEALGQLGEVVRGHLELEADAVPQKRFDALWREIDKAIDREAEAASPVKAKAEPAEPAGAWARIGRWFERYRGHLITGTVSAGAVAVLALVLRPTPETGTGGNELARGGQTGSDTGS